MKVRIQFITLHKYWYIKNYLYHHYIGEEDFHDVYGEIFTLTESYFKLGIVLGLPLQELGKIKKGFPSDLDQAFSEMLSVWLRHSYNIDKHRPPTWRRLVEAVDSDAGGNNHALAKKIASKHPTGLLVLLLAKRSTLVTLYKEITVCRLHTLWQWCTIIAIVKHRPVVSVHTSWLTT